MQALFLGEFGIYVKICYTLWRHDKRMKGKISNNDMQQRKRKNVITLSGQVISFFVEFLTSLFTVAQIFNSDMADPSVMPLVIIASTTIISMSQLWTSHECKRYIKFKLIDWKLLQEG